MRGRPENTSALTPPTSGPPHASRRGRIGVAVLVVAAAAAASGADDTIRVRTADGLREAVAVARPGTRIELAPGTYAGGFHFVGLRGAEGKPVVLAGADPRDPPVLRGGAEAIHLTDPEHVELSDLVLEDTANGLNLDDGGTPESPARHVLLRRLAVRDVGPGGNRDGIKLSGVEDFRVEDCTVERWGSGGSGIDIVGCRRGVIERCVFRQPAERPGDGSGVQAKGGSQDIAIRRNRFEHEIRAVNVGGSTGLAYFRPPLAPSDTARHEAKDVVVEGNTFVGAQAPVAFVGADGAVVRFNTLHLPGRWAARILQETREEAFVPCRNGAFTDNLVVFRSDRWSEGGVNVGPGTAPDTFRFARNVWYCVDAPQRTRALVRLPVREEDGVHGEDPRFRDADAGDFRVRPGSPAEKAGAHALPDAPSPEDPPRAPR